jgi:hypothetical protein
MVLAGAVQVARLAALIPVKVAERVAVQEVMEWAQVAAAVPTVQIGLAPAAEQAARQQVAGWVAVQPIAPGWVERAVVDQVAPIPVAAV